jgi:hypothetical protein
MIQRQKSSYRWQVADSELRLGALERATVDNNRGGNAGLIICEEGGFVNSDDYAYAIQSVIRPQLLRSGGKLVHVTTPSRNPLHYIHTETMPKASLANALHQYTIYDNPQLTAEQIAKALEDAGGADSDTWRREYLAQIFRDPQSMIVPTFDKIKHVNQYMRLPTVAKYWLVMDWGGVRDKTVALIYGYDFARNKIIFVKEAVFPANTRTEIIVNRVRELEAQMPDPILSRWVDCPGQLQVDLHQSHGFEVRLPIKDDWQAGINNTQLRFARNQVEIHPDCRFLIQSLESGQYNKHRTDFERSETLGHCDALAACMYGLRMVDQAMPSDLPNVPRSRYLHVKTTDSNEQIVSEAVVPKAFTQGGKRFGTFKR